MLKTSLISRLKRIDWDFCGSCSESLFSPIHWHPCRFASQIPASIIGLLTKPNDLILDPFCGAGTTLFEAQRLARRSIGIDISPISCLVSRAKTLPLRSVEIEGLIDTLTRDARRCLNDPPLFNHKPKMTFPKSVQADKWYTPFVGNQLIILWDRINKYHDARHVLAKMAFSSILLSVCRETRHWGYVCDNSSPIGNHEGDVLRTYIRVLQKVNDAYKSRDEELLNRFGEIKEIAASDVICSDVRAALITIIPRSVNLIITSPPYFGVCDYIKAQRLSNEWMGIDMEPLRLLEIGARSKRHRKSSSADYLSEMEAVFGLMKDCLSHNGIMALVIGESSKRESVLTNIRHCLNRAGFGIEIELMRHLSSQRRQAPSVHVEYIILASPQ